MMGEKRERNTGKRAQAATEFLMTYGWALLVVAAGIAALAYFGVLNPARFMPENCAIPTTGGMACLDFKITPDSATILLMNSGGRDLHIYNISVGDCSITPEKDFLDSQKQVFNITGCPYGPMGEKTKQELTITYGQKDSELTKTVQGKIVARIS